jgi:hypothetical protein
MQTGGCACRPSETNEEAGRLEYSATWSRDKRNLDLDAVFCDPLHELRLLFAAALSLSLSLSLVAIFAVVQRRDGSSFSHQSAGEKIKGESRQES